MENTLSKTRKIMNKFNIVANKRFGQNFLIDDNILQGIVDVADVEPVTSAITPVPGGVGPMTIAMLMNNCVEAKGLQE